MPGHNLTHAEAGERAALLEVHDYDVTLDLNRGAVSFATRTAISFSATAGSTTFIDFLGEAVHELRLNGHQLDVACWDGQRIHLRGLQRHNELEVVADADYSRTGEGLHRFVDPVDGEVYVYSQFEVADARRVFAVFEQPDLKARFTLTVTAPQHWQVISCSPTPAPEEAPDDPTSAVWRFAPSPPLPCYVTAVVAGPYHRRTGEATSSDGRIIPLGVFCRASLAEHLEADEIMATTRAGLELYEQLFDQPYPFTKLDQLFVPEFNAGAMENAGAVTITEDYIFRSAVPLARREQRVVTILHELAHMWFGNLVTMRWWDDLCLNESFAEYVATLATAERTEFHGVWATFCARDKAWAYAQDQLSTTHPVVADITNLRDVELNFDGITYAKGASLLKQLVAWVGREQFFTGLRAYFRRHAWSNAELGDLVNELATASGRDLQRWVQAHLASAGATVLRPRLVRDEQGNVTSAVLVHEATPQRTGPAASLPPQRVTVGSYEWQGHEGQALLRRTSSVVLDINGEHTPIVGLEDVSQPAMLLLNDEDLAYAKVRLDDTSLHTGMSHLSRVADPLARCLLWQLVWDMTRDSELAASDYINLTLEHVGPEAHSALRHTALGGLRRALTSYSSPLHRQELTRASAARIWQLVEQAGAGSDAQLQLLTTFAHLARDNEHLDILGDLLTERLVLPGRILDTDLRWQLLEALAAGGRDVERDITAELVRDATARGEQSATRVRAAHASEQAKEEVWARVATGDRLPNAMQEAAVAGFTRVHDPALLAPFVDHYFDSLTEIWQQRSPEMARLLVTGLFPRALAGYAEEVGTDVLARTEQWLTEAVFAPGGLRRLLLEERDELHRTLHAQALDRAVCRG